MNAEPDAAPRIDLVTLLGQSARIRQLIAHAAKELSSVGSSITLELSKGDSLPGARSAFERTESVAKQLLDVSDRLSAVTEALSSETRDRTMINHQLAAALEQEQGARDAALHDPLTGLANRVLFRDRLVHGIAQARRRRWILAVIFLDLDNFKEINDTHGHQAGDAVLRAVAMRLTQNTRRDDTVSRYGGDEFLYLLSQLHDESDITMIATKLLEAVQAPCSLGDVVVAPRLRASIGIALFPKDGLTADALIERADQAMYAAKESKSGFAVAQ